MKKAMNFLIPIIIAIVIAILVTLNINTTLDKKLASLMQGKRYFFNG